MQRATRAKRAGLLALALGLGGLSPAPAAAQPAEDRSPPPWHAGPGHHRGRPSLDRILERHAERLGLDAATQERIAALAAEANAETDALRERLHELHGAMRSLLREERPDEEAVMRQAERIGEAETEVRKQRLRTMLRIRKLLTPEQRRELVEIHRERGAREDFGAPDD